MLPVGSALKPDVREKSWPVQMFAFGWWGEDLVGYPMSAWVHNCLIYLKKPIEMQPRSIKSGLEAKYSKGIKHGYITFLIPRFTAGFVNKTPEWDVKLTQMSQSS